MKRARISAALCIGVLVAAVGSMCLTDGTAYAKSSRPARVRITYAKSLKTSRVTVKWKKVKRARTYKINYAYNKKFKKAKTIKVSSKKTKIIFRAKAGKTIYIRVKACSKRTSGKYSKVKKLKVRNAVSATKPVLKEDGLYHCSALKYGYRLYTGITSKLYSKCNLPFYIKTNNPDDSFSIEYYDQQGRKLECNCLASSYADINRGSLSTPYWTGKYHVVSGGYISVVKLYRTDSSGNKVYPSGKITVKITETGSSTKKMTAGTINLEDYDAAHKAWLKDILNKSGANSKTTGEEKMNAICSYLCSHVKYTRCYKGKDSQVHYITTIADSLTPSFVSMSYNSYTSPYELEYIGSQIGYPVRSMYYDYARGTGNWSLYHSRAIHESDKKMYSFCPNTSTGLISQKTLTKDEALDLIPQIDVKKLSPVTIQ